MTDEPEPIAQNADPPDPDDPVDGVVDPDLVAELPGLRLRVTTVDGVAGRTPRALRQRLEDVSDRFRGANAIALRTRPVPRAYRVFFRQVGLDPTSTARRSSRWRSSASCTASSTPATASPTR